MWRLDDPQGNEADKCKYDIVQYTRGVGLDVGCGPKKAFPHFLGIDSQKDTELFGIKMKPDVVCKDAADLSDCVKDASVDFVFSSHLLEHIVDHNAALRDWWRCLKVGGHLVLYLPHRNLYPNIGRLGANPDHVHDFTEDDILDAMSDIGSWTLLVEEVRDQDREYSFLQVFQKNDSGFQVMAPRVRPAKSACVVRYGGFGDSIQAAGILPELKRQGYFVVFMTTPRGHEILKHDPHIDEFMLQDEDQVPNHELPLFWASQAKRFDRFINLSESVEGTLLAFPGRTNHGWPHSVRKVELNKNYLEWTARLAELPYSEEARFFPSPEEKKKAAAMLSAARNRLATGLPIPMRAKERFNVLWCLAGSSVHKFYPHQDTVIQGLLDNIPELLLILNGDEPCKILEAGWEETERIMCTSGEVGIRDSLTLAQQVDLVVGPETGILNSVAFEPVPKVIMLSHSSHENLTKHWKLTDVMEPQGTNCYPCHRLHYGKEFCHEDAETGAALCQQNISPNGVFLAIMRRYEDWKLDMRLAA